MPPPTFTPPKPPSREDGSGRATTDSRDLIAPFGDGYEQRGSDGINSLSRSVPLVFAYLSGSQADTLCGFFDGQGRALPFIYQLPWEAAPRQWRIAGAAGAPLYVRDMGRGLTVRVEISFKECFDLGSGL